MQAECVMSLDIFFDFPDFFVFLKEKSLKHIIGSQLELASFEMNHLGMATLTLETLCPIELETR